jgi:hypothetical protein
MPHALQMFSEVSKHEVTFTQARSCVTTSNSVLWRVRTFSVLDVSYIIPTGLYVVIKKGDNIQHFFFRRGF